MTTTRSRFQKRGLPLLVCLCVALCVVGCLDPSAVKRYAAVSKKAGEQFPVIAGDLPASCARQQRYYVLSGSWPDLDSLRENSEAACKEYEEIAVRLVRSNRVLVSYLTTLGRLSANEIVTYDKSLDDFAGTLTDTYKFEKDAVDAVQGLSALLMTAVAGEWRRGQLEEAIENANGDVQVLSRVLGRIVGEDYTQLLDTESEAARKFYLGKINDHQSTEPLTVVLVHEQWQSDEDTIQMRRVAAGACVKILAKIAKGHGELYTHRNDLGSKEVKRLVVEYTTVVEELVTDIDKAFQ